VLYPREGVARASPPDLGLLPEFRLVEVHAGLVEAEGTYDSSGPQKDTFGRGAIS
jgi:hypothetical protein